jgi:uncharacterized protein YecT (DUF1311 family)
MIRILCIAALLLAAPAALAAQDDDRCPNARTQAAMNECAGDELARADSVLNERYRQLLRVFAAEPERLARLRAAQRAWIPFRDAHCEFVASEFEGGTMQPMIDALCTADLTAQRADELAEILRLATGR